MKKIITMLLLGWRRFKRWYKGLYIGRPWWMRTLVALATLIVCFILYLIAVDINFLWLFGKSPSTRSIMNPPTMEASHLYSADGVEIGKFFDENRTPVKYDEISPDFFNVLIATEDERFYKHHGIDFAALGAAVKDLMLHGRARGASTITQQLVKNMFRMRTGTEYSSGLLGYIPGVKMVITKSKEWIIATKIEIFYSKQEILEMYANTVDFGSNAYGIKTAAKTYFNTTPDKLLVQESAVLVGLLKATSTYNPRLNPKNSLKRRNLVLAGMCEQGKLTQAQCDSLSAIPIELHFSTENAYSGQALYFKQEVARQLQRWCNETGHNLYTDGLKIHTTIDTRMQRYAEEAVTEKMKIVQQNFKSHWGNGDCWVDDKGKMIANFVEDKAQHTDVYKGLLARYPNNLDSVNYYMNQPHRVHLFDYDNDSLYMEMSSMDSISYMLHFMHTGFIAIEPGSGHVKAWVGDIDFTTWKYDNVHAMHQPGSTFKLFVYAAAMEHGLAPCVHRRDEYFDTLIFNKNSREMEHWHPTNADGRFTGADMTLRTAFARSINSVAVRVALDTGIPIVAQTARDMGITSELDETPAIALGASDVNLLELASAFGTVANDGMHHEPVLVTKILDKDGKVIYTEPTETYQAITYRTAFFLQQMLMASRTDAGGTSMSINGYISPSMYDTDFGGKTGTSNRHADAWFVCVTPRLVCGAWVGGQYRQIHFRTGALGQGSRTALPICGAFMQRVFNDKQFQHYHAKYGKPKEYIDPALYQGCTTYLEVDTTFVDSTLVDSLDLGNDLPPTPPDSI
ncbi:MAG: penicillin-binding protein [Muribaculaceae bacterium]|nr:penicillin-binding protein [Muribaculaceae bacterium]